MSAFELLGLVGLAAGAVSGAAGLALAYFELVRWRRLRRARRRLLAIAARERAAAAALSPRPYGRRVVSLDYERARRRGGCSERDGVRGV